MSEQNKTRETEGKEFTGRKRVNIRPKRNAVMRR